MALTVEFGDDESREMDADRSCSGKVRYGHQETAERVARHLASKGRSLEPYPCPYCDGWHWGHRLPWWLRWVLGRARG